MDGSIWDTTLWEVAIGCWGVLISGFKILGSVVVGLVFWRLAQMTNDGASNKAGSKSPS